MRSKAIPVPFFFFLTVAPSLVCAAGFFPAEWMSEHGISFFLHVLSFPSYRARRTIPNFRSPFLSLVVRGQEAEIGPPFFPFLPPRDVGRNPRRVFLPKNDRRLYGALNRGCPPEFSFLLAPTIRASMFFPFLFVFRVFA